MANDLYEANPNTSPSGSSLGKYYTRLRIGKYLRPDPFQPVKWDPTLVVYLPIPDQLQDSTTVNYSNMNLEAVGDFINKPTEFAPTALFRKAGDISSGLLTGAGGAAAEAVVSKRVGDMVSKQIGSIFPADKINSAIQQSIGATPNPNPSVMFQGPSLRTFSYTWAFYPRSKAESYAISQLIKKLKARALPTFNNKQNTTILNYPYMCQLNFYPWDNGGNDKNGDYGWSENSIIKIKRCFMDSVNVKYNAYGTPAFFEGTNLPISYQLTISFREIEYMTGRDWDKDYAEEANKAYGEFNAIKEMTSGAISTLVTGVIPAIYGAFKEASIDLFTSTLENAASAPPSQETQSRITAGSDATVKLQTDQHISYVNPTNNQINTIERGVSASDKNVPTITVKTYNLVTTSTTADGKPVYHWDPATPSLSRTFTTDSEALSFINENKIFENGTKLSN